MSKPIVLITRDDFPPVSQKLLEEKFKVKVWTGKKPMSRDELKENVKGVYAIYTSIYDNIDKEIIEAAGGTLKVVSTFSVGVDHLNVAELKASGVKIGYTPGIVTEAVAEHGIALVLATARRVVESSRFIRNGDWQNTPWFPMLMCGRGLEKSTVGIVGGGRVGCSLANKLKAFCIERLLYFDKLENPGIKALGGELKTLEEVMKESDFVFITLAQNEETKGIISKERINAMKPNAILVNIARGGLLDYEALTEALQKKKIAGAALDVTNPEPLDKNHPLVNMENVVITPHTASATFFVRAAMGELAANNIIAVLEGKEMPAELKI